jgi:hypothetical protein
MEVVSIGDKKEKKRKDDMLEVLDEMRRQVEAGEIVEFVATSLDNDGIAQIHICAMDMPGSVGLYEIGKHLLIAQETYVFD